MLVALNTIDTEQAHTTTITMGAIVWLLNYATTHPDATIKYLVSNMILYVSSNASYICKERAHS